MKFSQIVFALFLVCLVGFNFAYSQDNSKKEKSKNKKTEQNPIVVKANVAVLDAAENFVDNIKLEDLKVFEDGVEQKITYFVKKEPILNLGLVVDNSGSMKKNLDELMKSSSIIIDSLLPDSEVFVVRFVDSDTIEVIQEWTSNKKDLKEAIEIMFVQGGQSTVLDAVYLSAEKILERERKDKSKRYAIILISDAEERDSYYNFDEIMALFKGTDLQVFLLSFAENAPLAKKKARLLSHLLTLETGGTVYSLPKKHSQDDILHALKSIFGELRSQYIIGYTSTNQKRDGLPRKLSIQVTDSAKGETRKGVIRESFVVPKE